MKINPKTQVAIHSFSYGKNLIHQIFVGEKPYGKRGGKCGRVVSAGKFLRTSGFRGAPLYFRKLVEIIHEISASVKQEIEISNSALVQAAWRLSR